MKKPSKLLFSLFMLNLFLTLFLLSGCFEPTGSESSSSSLYDSSSSEAQLSSVPAVLTGGFYLSDTGTMQACFWLDTNFTPLVTNNVYSYAGSAVISGENMYVAGSYNNHACWWSNSILYMADLNSDSYSASYAIAISDNTVYNCGYTENSIFNSACYWSNTTLIPLTNSLNTNWSEAFAIDFSGGEVYTAGYFVNLSSGNETACFWKGTEMTPLQTTTLSHAFAIAVIGDNVYTAGENAGVACYWVNGSIHSTGLTGSCAFAIYVNGNDVYTAGYFKDGTTNRACYWINNILHTNGNTSGYSCAYRISFKNNSIITSGVYSTNGFNIVNNPGSFSIMKSRSINPKSLAIPGYQLEACVWQDNNMTFIGPEGTNSAISLFDDN